MNLLLSNYCFRICDFRYRVELQVEDGFGETVFVAFDQVMEKIIGILEGDVGLNNDNVSVTASANYNNLYLATLHLL